MTYMALTHSAPHLFLVATTTTTASTTKSGSSSLFFLVIIALLAGFYFLRIRPNQQRRMQALRQTRAFDVGDEVVAGGMLGTVTEVNDDEVEVEVSHGFVVRFVPRAVQSRAAYAASTAGRGGRGAPMPAPRKPSADLDHDQTVLDNSAWPSTDDETDGDISSGLGTDASGTDGGAPTSGDR